MIRTRSWLFTVLLIVVLLSTVTMSAFATAATATPASNIQSQPSRAADTATITPTALPCYSLDVVFVIDQSGSMGGVGSLAPNDPTGQRAYGPRWAIDFLADNALNVCPDAFHRVAMVSFGTETEVDLPLSDINPENEEEWTYVRSNLKASIFEKKMGETDPESAFMEAIDILDEAGSIGDAPRKRVIIFMTDGMPCVEKLGCVYKPGQPSTFDFVSYAKKMKRTIDAALPFSENLLKQEQCINKLREIYGSDHIPAADAQQCMQDFKVTNEDYENSTYIYTMLISYGSAWPKALRDVYSAMSSEHGGRVIDITDNRGDIPANFLTIMTQLSGVPVTRLSCGSFAVNPYVKQARLTFFKLDDTIPVTLSYTDKNGVTHQVVDGVSDGGFDVDEHYSEGANERYVFDMPYAGIWNIDSTACDGIDAYYEMVKLDLGIGNNPLRIWSAQTGAYMNPDGAAMPEYDIEPYYNEDKAFYLSYEMVDTAGNVVLDSDNPVYGVKAVATIAQPNKQKQTLNLVWLPEEKRLRSDTPILLPEPGQYTVDLIGTIPVKTEPYGPIFTQEPAKVFDQQMELFRLEGIQFNVFEVTPLKLVIDAPTSGQTLRPIHKTWWQSDFKLPLQVEPIVVKAHIVNDDGSPVDANAQIMIDPQQGIVAVAKKGELASQEVYLQPDAGVPGGFRGVVTGFAAEDLQDLTVMVAGDYDNHYRFASKEAAVSISRFDGILNRDTTYKVLLGIVIGIVLLNLFLFFRNHRNTLSGTLEFAVSGATADAFMLRGKRVVRFGPGKFKDKDYLDLYRMQVENLTKLSKPKPQKGDDEGNYNPTEELDSGTKVRVKMCLTSERKGLRGLFNAMGWFPRWDRNYELSNGESVPYSEYSQASVEYKG